MKFVERMNLFFERSGKVRTMNYLRSRSEYQIIEWGFSPALLKQGIHQWPWREADETYSVDNIKQSISQRSTETVSIESLKNLQPTEIDLSGNSSNIRTNNGHPRATQQDSEAA